MKIWTSNLNLVLSGLKSCSAVKERLKLQQELVVTVYNHTLPSQKCEIPGFPAICIHPRTNRACLQPAWLSVRGDVTPTAVCFSILFQAQEKDDKVVTSYACCMTDSWEALLAWRVEIATFSHPEEKRKS